jgi:anthraniloyl-CoA monooxygenase
MKIACVGGGPTGLYFAILAKVRDSRHEVTVYERNEPGTTHGWGVSWGDELLDDVYATDPASGRALRGISRMWDGQKVFVDGADPVHIGGRYGFSANRTHMQDVLTARATELGVDLRYGHTVEDPDTVDADLLVAADGVGSQVRTQHADAFGPAFTPGVNRYIWLGTRKTFDSFQWHFRRTDAGWIWCWIYPSAHDNSTVIVECSPETWAGLGFDGPDHDAHLRRLDELFAEDLSGHRLMDPPAARHPSDWRVFREIRNRVWHHGRIALAGDAAHTTHFGIGSGTTLAVQDSIQLARLALAPGADVPTALAAYTRVRRAAVERIQEAAASSMRWFETADERLAGQDPVKIAYSLFDRRGDQAPWRYQVHLATQIEPLRHVRRQLTAARRTVKGVARDRRRPAAG